MYIYNSTPQISRYRFRARVCLCAAKIFSLSLADDRINSKRTLTGDDNAILVGFYERVGVYGINGFAGKWRLEEIMCMMCVVEAHAHVCRLYALDDAPLHPAMRMFARLGRSQV